MKLGYLVAIAGVGVVLSTSLSACGGFSDLGQGVGQGGEGADEGSGASNAMGGSENTTGGVGGSETMTGGVGGSETMTGGSNAMGGSETMTGGVGGSETMTGGTNAMGGSHTMTGGTNAMGGSHTMTGGVGGSSTMPQCMSPDDCPQPPPLCITCGDGTNICHGATCLMGVCGIDLARCPEEKACVGLTCGDRCSTYTTNDPSMMGPMMGGGMVPLQACNVEGLCTPVFDDGSNLGCLPDLETGACMTDSDCPESGMCASCSGGDGCLGFACIDSVCVARCKTDYACMTRDQCPMHAEGSNVCTPGPWLCEEGTCALDVECGL